jgi:hypothetical protein
MDFSKLPNLKKLPNQDKILENTSNTFFTKHKEQSAAEILNELDAFLAKLSVKKSK